MSAVLKLCNPLDVKIAEHVSWFQDHVQKRDPALFADFLKNGYEMTTLNSVSSDFLEDVLIAKQCLGTLITLADDLADDLQYVDRTNLDLVHHHMRSVATNRSPQKILAKSQHEQFAIELVETINEKIAVLPNYEKLKDLLQFDMELIALANQRSYLSTTLPFCANYAETKAYGHHNMGMIAAGMIDLMACQELNQGEIGALREIFFKGQRIGRIYNQVYTLARELKEKDVTNEILFHQSKGRNEYVQSLLIEANEWIDTIAMQKNIKSFDVGQYAEGLRRFGRLHQKLSSRI